MEPLTDRLRKKKILLVDGSVEAALIERGVGPVACPESFNLFEPDIVEETAGLYLEAGADIVRTNTSGASTFSLSDYGLEGKSVEINRRGVRIARAAVGERAYIAGTCGSSGRLLRPHGDAVPENLYGAFHSQAMVLIMEGVDLISFEAMLDEKEAAIAVLASKTASPNTPIMASVIFGRGPEGFRTITGAGVKQVTERLEKAGADIIGSACGNGIEQMIELAREFKELTSLPLVIKPDTGRPDTPELFAGKARELIEAGVSIIGGCCGMTPEHVRRLRNLIDGAEP
jgi:5-methyltetrahydrofolate--homocysteine methyltransferase